MDHHSFRSSVCSLATIFWMSLTSIWRRILAGILSNDFFGHGQYGNPALLAWRRSNWNASTKALPCIGNSKAVTEGNTNHLQWSSQNLNGSYGTGTLMYGSFKSSVIIWCSLGFFHQNLLSDLSCWVIMKITDLFRDMRITRQGIQMIDLSSEDWSCYLAAQCA